jgi:hypothetical protein
MENKVVKIIDGEHKINIKHRRENGFHKSIIVCGIVDGEIRELIDCRFYWPGTVCYCCLWTHFGNWNNGSGYAGGYGYCKLSSAAGEAIRNAGYVLEHSIDGVGEEAIKEALLAIAKNYGYTDLKCIVAHG